ncbi:hypothetical protein [Bartonella tribocorum]|uniref:Uncharacterized protein n=1 Tax=Bartonella tribocorum TaxID=85701 RepID=A0A2N9Y9I9_9HYPH|nr:hypothetical protein [Bartonella tribocorum]PIT68372.1 hypothetical protein CER18_07355 [Bartonella tribocorum]
MERKVLLIVPLSLLARLAFFSATKLVFLMINWGDRVYYRVQKNIMKKISYWLANTYSIVRYGLIETVSQ